MGIVYLDGEFVLEHEAKISVMDRGFLCGDGAYTTIQVREGQPLFLKAHLRRLQENCAHLKIAPPFIEEGAIEELIEKNRAQEGIWRLKILITGGEDPEMRLPERSFGHLVMALKPFVPLPMKPLRFTCFPIPFGLCHASFKSLAHLNRYYVMEYAHASQYDDAVTATESGILLEASFGNLLWVDEKTKTAWTPSSTLPLHVGVTVSVLKEILRKDGYHIDEVKWTLKDVPEGIALFRVNTMSLIRPVACIDHRDFPLHPSLQAFLMEQYEERAGIKKAALAAPL